MIKITEHPKWDDYVNFCNEKGEERSLKGFLNWKVREEIIRKNGNNHTIMVKS